MISLGTEGGFIVPNIPGNTNKEMLPLGKVGWTDMGRRIRVKQIPAANGRIISVKQDKTAGTDLGRRMPVVYPNMNRDICFDVGDMLKFIEDTFGGALKQKLLRDIKHVETIETALLSESALAKDWLTPEEDEAWSNL